MAYRNQMINCNIYSSKGLSSTNGAQWDGAEVVNQPSPPRHTQDCIYANQPCPQPIRDYQLSLHGEKWNTPHLAFMYFISVWCVHSIVCHKQRSMKFQRSYIWYLGIALGMRRNLSKGRFLFRYISVKLLNIMSTVSFVSTKRYTINIIHWLLIASDLFI